MKRFHLFIERGQRYQLGSVAVSLDIFVIQAHPEETDVFRVAVAVEEQQFARAECYHVKTGHIIEREHPTAVAFHGVFEREFEHSSGRINYTLDADVRTT